jgi:hypothetical protein
MVALNNQKNLLDQAHLHLGQLSEDRLKVAVDFLAYLQQKDEWEATEKMLNIPDFEQELLEAQEELKRGDIVSLESIYRS